MNCREFFRIVYPWDERPRLVFHDQICEVLDCSERGIRFRMSLPPHPRVGTELAAKLRLQRGKDLVVRGVVVRVCGAEVALHLLDAGIPFHQILKEQIHLRRLAGEATEHA